MRYLRCLGFDLCMQHDTIAPMSKSGAVFTMFCQRCGYPLDGASSKSCPECGRAFDPDNALTFDQHAWAWRSRRLTRLAFKLTACVALIMFLAVGSWIGWLYAEDARTRRAEARIQALGGKSYTVLFWPEQRWESLEQRWSWFRAPRKLKSAEIWHTSATDDDLAIIARSSVQWLHLSNTQISDQGMQHLRDHPTITNLHAPHALTDAGLASIATIPNLKMLDLNGTQVTGSGLAHLAGHANLANLGLGRLAIHPGDLTHLQNLPSLRSFVLVHPMIDDQHVNELIRLPQIERVTFWHTSITPAGFQRLEQQRPDVKWNY